MSHRALLRLRLLGWFLLAVGATVFVVALDEGGIGLAMLAGLALGAVGTVLAGLRYIVEGRAGDAQEGTPEGRLNRP